MRLRVMGGAHCTRRHHWGMLVRWRCCCNMVHRYGGAGVCVCVCWAMSMSCLDIQHPPQHPPLHPPQHPPFHHTHLHTPPPHTPSTHSIHCATSMGIQPCIMQPWVGIWKLCRSCWLVGVVQINVQPMVLLLCMRRLTRGMLLWWRHCYMLVGGGGVCVWYGGVV